MAEDDWISPDGKIKKVIVTKGIEGLKPTENAECVIKTSDSNFHKTVLKIGDNDGECGRLLDIVLQTMNVSEVARITFLTAEPTEFTLELQNFTPCGLIYEWNAFYKYNLAMEHKEKGVALFKAQHNKDASHRFSKALKILLSIPIDAEKPPTSIDGVSMEEITNLKATLYSNLASCYLKVKEYDRVLELCERTLKNDSQNIKAIYKMATSAFELRDYERALDCFKKVLEVEPENKAAQQGVLKTAAKIKEQEQVYKNIVKRMF